MPADPTDPAEHAHVVDMHALHEATEAAKAAGVTDIHAVNETVPTVPVPGPDTPTWTTDDDRLVFTDAEGYTASLTRFGGNAALAAGFHALVADVRAARAHERCGPATDTLQRAREALPEILADLYHQADISARTHQWRDLHEIANRIEALLVGGGTDG